MVLKPLLSNHTAIQVSVYKLYKLRSDRKPKTRHQKGNNVVNYAKKCYAQGRHIQVIWIHS